ncbi:MAG: carbon-nitrogen hydrolase family protein [Verrucomicrobiota bacterium]
MYNTSSLHFRSLLLLVATILSMSSMGIAGSDPVLSTPPQTVRVAAVQCSSDLGEVAANTQKLSDLVKSAAENGAKIVVLPEASITGYMSQDGKTNWHLDGWPLENDYVGKDPSGYAEPVPGPSTLHFCQLAKDLGIYLTIPLVEVEFHGDPLLPYYFNTVCLASPSGELVLHYRKINPWPYAEKSWATAGDHGLQTYDTEYGRVGIAICYDIHTILEDYQRKDLWTLLFSTAWADAEYPADWFYHELPDKVKLFNHHLISANWSVDAKQAWRGYGFSVVISNEGRVLATAKSLYGSDIVFADLPMGKS